MKFKSLRDKGQAIALFSSAACFVSSLCLAHFYLARFSALPFWFFLLVGIVFAALSFPRWKSLVALTTLALALWWSGGRAFATYHSTRRSPDDRYKLVTYRIPMLFAFPGQASDASGYVQLQDKSGRVLSEGYVQMVQIVYDADWTTHEVQIGKGDYSYTWKLP